MRISPFLVVLKAVGQIDRHRHVAGASLQQTPSYSCPHVEATLHRDAYLQLVWHQVSYKLVVHLQNQAPPCPPAATKNSMHGLHMHEHEAVVPIRPRARGESKEGGGGTGSATERGRHSFGLMARHVFVTVVAIAAGLSGAFAVQDWRMLDQ